MTDASNRKTSFPGRLAAAEELSLNCVTKTFLMSENGRLRSSRLILDSVDFALVAGRVVGLVGRTGVGKTTLGKMLTGLLNPDGGFVALGDIRLGECGQSRLQQIRGWLRYVPQNPDAVLSFNSTVAEALKDARLCMRVERQERGPWLRLLEDSVLFDPQWLHRDIGDLSLGQRRRVVNLRALQTCPRFIVFDEPFNGLDLTSKNSMLLLVRRVSREKHAGVLYISHDVEALRSSCDEIWQLESGKLTRLPDRASNQSLKENDHDIEQGRR